MAILYPTSLANLVVEVGTRHCHQTLLKMSSAKWRRFCLGLNVLKVKNKTPVLLIEAGWRMHASVRWTTIIPLCNEVVEVYWFHSVCPSVCKSVRPSIPNTVSALSLLHYWMDSFHPPITTGVRGCVAHNDIWPWPISFRSFRYDFATKLLKYGTLVLQCLLYSMYSPYSAQMIIYMRWRVACHNPSPWPLSSR